MLGLGLFYFICGSPLVQQTEVSLPPNGNHATENAPVLDRYVREGKGRDYRPDFTTVDPARGYGMLNSFDDLGDCCAGEKGLHAKEIGIEEWSKEGLIYHDL
jgi:hypothetical protein